MSCECGHHGAPPSAIQSLDEMEFERGLWAAAQHGDSDRVKLLLSRGHEADKRDAAGYTPLHYAARNGHLGICKLLLQNGAFINAATCQGHATALHRAAAVGHLDIVQFLISKKADVTMKDIDGKTALHRGANGGHYDICAQLVKMEPELKHDVDNRGKMPVDYANTDQLAVLLK